MAVQVRKTVTVVFADIVGSTSLAEEFDAEAIRIALDRYFAIARSVLERHGGMVEKFIGDAVMAVFGIPEVREDDALRAVRAAVELRDHLAALDSAVPIGIRIGVTTGEVVAGGGETYATGDAVNVAARLESAAAPGEILVGAQTYALVADAVRAEVVEPLEVKGKTDRVAAYRLHEVLPDAVAFTRRLDAPFVGRGVELAALLDELVRAERERVCRLVVVVGEAGIGKSRLVRELVQAAGEARVLVGRCLSYGDGITYWALREIVQQLGGSEPHAALAQLVDDTGADAILGAVGLAPVVAQNSDIHWSVRRLLEELVRDRTLLLVVDDVHWAEPTFVDLLDYVHTFVRDAPILLVATGRPELLDARPAWRTAAVELGPLADDDAAGLVAELASALSADARDRIVAAAEGNPFFVEQLLAAGGGDDDDELHMPPTIQALLTARIDALPPGERHVAECAAVEGRLFHRGAVQELMPADERGDVLAHLLALMRRGLIRADESIFRGDDGFRFAHALIRDAAYDRAPKTVRADLHERYAAWLGRVAGAGEFDEIVAYHLEQAALLGVDVGHPRSDLAREAGRLLVAGGRRAFRRGDVRAASGLFGRAVDVLPPSVDRADALALQALAAIHTGNVDLSLASSAAARSDPHAGSLSVARAEISGALARILSGAGNVDEIAAVVQSAIEALRGAGDDWWAARGLFVLANAAATNAVFGPAVELLSRVFELPAAMDDPAIRGELFFWIGGALMLGPVPVPEARARLEALRADVRTPLEEAWLAFPLATLCALQGEFGEARRLFAGSRTAMKEAGADVYYAACAMFVGRSELLAGDAETAERVLREGWDMLGAVGERGLRSTVGAYLGMVLHELGRDQDAEDILHEASALTHEGDVSTQTYCRGVLSRVRSAAGRHAEAMALAHEAVDIAARSDSSWHHLDAQLWLAAAAAAAGFDDIRRRAAAEAMQLVEQRGLSAYRDRAAALGAA